MTLAPTGTVGGCVYELQMLQDVAPSVAASDSRCIRTLPPEVAWAVAAGVDMLVASPTFDNDLHDDSQFVACLQEGAALRGAVAGSGCVRVQSACSPGRCMR